MNLSKCRHGTTVELLFFVFEISLELPNYRVKYYDYIVKWCSGLACNWCVSLDISIILALRVYSLTASYEAVLYSAWIEIGSGRTHHMPHDINAWTQDARVCQQFLGTIYK